MARIEVPMPQMGESIAEGTVSKWIKKVGDAIGRDEPLLEISTDKVDAEIPAPAAGTLTEIAVKEGQTVEVGTVLGYIETDKSAAQAAPAPAAEKTQPAAAEKPAASEEANAPAPAKKPAAPAQPERAAPAAAQAAPADGDGRGQSAEERLRQKSSPLVRRIAAEHNIDVREVPGTGQAGRVTKNDIMSYLEQREQPPAVAPARGAGPPRTAPTVSAPGASENFWDIFYGKGRHPEFPAREGDRA